MKRIMTAILCIGIIASNTALAGIFQQNEGTFTYDVVYKESEGMMMTSGSSVPVKQKIKKGTDFQFHFLLKGDKAKFQKIEEPQSGDVQMRSSFNFSSSSSQTEEPKLEMDEFKTSYYNFDEGLRYGLATVLERDVIVEEYLTDERIKVSPASGSKTIAGYKCKKAVSDDGTTTVWYTEDVSLRTPWTFEGINGTILEMENDMRTVTALEFSGSAIADASFSMPNGRKMIELEQYQDLKKEEQDVQMQKLMERMKENGQNISFGKNGGITFGKSSSSSDSTKTKKKGNN